MHWIVFLYGIVAGYFANSIGLGAGIFLMPFFLLLNVPYQDAVSACLMTVFSVSIFNTYLYYKRRVIPKTPVLIMVLPASVVALLCNSLLLGKIPAYYLQVVYAGIMFLNVDFMRRAKYKGVQSIKFQEMSHANNIFLYVALATLSGLLAGLLGLGGGLIMIPLLIYFAHYDPKDAVRITAPVTASATFFSLFGNIVTFNLPVHIGGSAAVGAMLGGYFGGIALRYIKKDFITKMNCSVSFILGCLMLGKALF